MEWMPAEVLADPPPNARAWDGSAHAPPATVPRMDAGAMRESLSSAAVFVAHSRALPAGGAAALSGRRVWTSGSASWFRLAEQGVWVEGCVDGRGVAAAEALHTEPL
jgi:hypothetical protein